MLDYPTITKFRCIPWTGEAQVHPPSQVQGIDSIRNLHDLMFNTSCYSFVLSMRPWVVSPHSACHCAGTQPRQQSTFVLTKFIVGQGRYPAALPCWVVFLFLFPRLLPLLNRASWLIREKEHLGCRNARSTCPLGSTRGSPEWLPIGRGLSVGEFGKQQLLASLGSQRCWLAEAFTPLGALGAWPYGFRACTPLGPRGGVLVTTFLFISFPPRDRSSQPCGENSLVPACTQSFRGHRQRGTFEPLGTSAWKDFFPVL